MGSRACGAAPSEPAVTPPGPGRRRPRSWRDRPRGGEHSGTESAVDRLRRGLRPHAVVAPSPPPPRTGACYIRVQVHGAGAWYRVVVNPDVVNARGEQSYDVGDLEATMALVREFLATFEPTVER
jgi:hypothetical protein